MGSAGMGWGYPGNNFPIQDLDGYDVSQLPEAFQGKGVLKNCYDFKIYDTIRLQPGVTVPTIQATLFQNPVGTQKAIVGAAATQYTQQLTDTNMRQSGQLPKGRFFVVQAIEVMCMLTGNLPTISADGQNIELPTVQGYINANDAAASSLRTLLTQMYGYFYLGTKPMAEGQLTAFPSSEGITGFGSATGTNATPLIDSIANNGFGCAWNLQEPIGIQQYMNFAFVIQCFNTFTVLAATSQVIKVTLKGLLYDQVM